MAWFHSEKKKEGKGGGAIDSIQVLGSGCKSCHALLENTKEAVRNLGLTIEVEYVTDLQRIKESGLMSMPGLMVNGKAASAGKVLKTSEVEKILQKLGA